MSNTKDNLIAIFKTTLDNFLRIEPSIFEEIVGKLEFQTIKSKVDILKEGTVCKEIGFICSGIMRAYEMVDGEEKIMYFNFQPKNPIISNYQSFISEKPSKFNIKTITNCETFFIKRDDLYELFEKYHTVERLGRILAEHHYIDAMERIISFQRNDTKQMYLDLKNLYPHLNRDVPDRMIASYLGIRKETLSRIKKEILFS